MGLPVTASPDRTVQDLLGMSRGGVGASTGFMEEDRGHWGLLLDWASSVSDQVIELSALSAPELPGLIGFLEQRPQLDFTYVSVHGPSKGRCSEWSDLAATLYRRLPEYVDSVVMHPGCLGDPLAFRVLGSKLILENMDSLKPTARTVDELQPYFAELPDAGFCFDIAHAQINDRTMGLAHELIDAFGDRLREVHLSSIQDDGSHVSLRERDIESYWPVLRRCTHVPWVLEAALPGNL